MAYEIDVFLVCPRSSSRCKPHHHFEEEGEAIRIRPHQCPPGCCSPIGVAVASNNEILRRRTVPDENVAAVGIGTAQVLIFICPAELCPRDSSEELVAA